MSDMSPFPTWSPTTLLSSCGTLTTLPTLVICAFLLSSLYTTYIHCGLGGADFKHVQWRLPSSFSVTVKIYPKATSLGVFLRGKGLLQMLNPSPHVVECALLYLLLNKACSLLKSVLSGALICVWKWRSWPALIVSAWGLVFSRSRLLRDVVCGCGIVFPLVLAIEGVLSLNLCSWDEFKLPSFWCQQWLLGITHTFLLSSFLSGFRGKGIVGSEYR